MIATFPMDDLTSLLFTFHWALCLVNLSFGCKKKNDHGLFGQRYCEEVIKKVKTQEHHKTAGEHFTEVVVS